MFLLLLASLAFAQDSNVQALDDSTLYVDPNAPVIDFGVQVIPPGSLLISPGDDTGYSIVEKSFLLPESYYDKALAKAERLDACTSALDTCTEKALDLRTLCSDRLNTCLDQFNDDQQWQDRALAAEAALQKARRDKWVAWAITGGLVLGATATTVASLSK